MCVLSEVHRLCRIQLEDTFWWPPVVWDQTKCMFKSALFLSRTIGKDKCETHLKIPWQGERGRVDGDLYSSYHTCRQKRKYFSFIAHSVQADKNVRCAIGVKRRGFLMVKKSMRRQMSPNSFLIKQLEKASVLAFALLLYDTLNGVKPGKGNWKTTWPSANYFAHSVFFI